GQDRFARLFRRLEVTALPLRPTRHENRPAAAGERPGHIRVRDRVESQFDQIGAGRLVAAAAKFGHGRRGHGHAQERFGHKRKKPLQPAAEEASGNPVVAVARSGHRRHLDCPEPIPKRGPGRAGRRRNLILARLEGGPLAHTGVIAGMSGSPVYVDGKLIGAVSYALGSFSKEPIAGITPIAEMTDAASLATSRPPGARVHVDFPLTRESLTAAFGKALNWNRPFADRANDALLTGISPIAGLPAGQIGTLPRPI